MKCPFCDEVYEPKNTLWHKYIKKHSCDPNIKYKANEFMRGYVNGYLVQCVGLVDDDD